MIGEQTRPTTVFIANNINAYVIAFQQMSVVDIDLMICNATNISSWVSLTVSGQSSEGQQINCWIRAPPLGDGGHVTCGLTVHTGLSLGAEFFIRLS